MEIDLSVLPGLTLRIDKTAGRQGVYATSQLQKGLLLVYNGEELAEEAVGFGVPVLKLGLQAIFPGYVELALRRSGPVSEISATYVLNLAERVARRGRGAVSSTSLYAIKDRLAALIRGLPLLRGPLTAASSGLRRLLEWETTYEEAGFCTQLQVIYTVDGSTGRIDVQANAAHLLREGVTEVAIMNEQGGRHFAEYRDSLGVLLRGPAIGCWDEVAAQRASFVSPACDLAFTLEQAPGARLFRGRELVGSRLAWSGFGYTFSPGVGTFGYALSVGRVP